MGTDQPGAEHLTEIGKRILKAVRREDDSLVDRLEPRLRAPSTPVRFRNAWIEVEFAYAFLQRGIDYVHEPRITNARELVWRTGGPEEEKSDFGIRPDGRQVNVEIKTLLPHDERPGSPYGPFQRELHERLRPRLTEIDGNRNVRFRIASSLADFSDRLSKVAKIVAHEATHAIEREGEIADVPVEFEGKVLGHLTTRSDSMWAVSTVRPGHGSVEPNVLRRLKEAQTVTNCPNVVVLNTTGQPTPTPFELEERLTGRFSGDGAFDDSSIQDVSAVLLYVGNRQRALLLNPNAGRPLTDAEQRVLEEPFEYPEQPQ